MNTKPDTRKYPVKKYPTIGVCGLDCGLCPRYYTAGPSRCPGCCGPDFFQKHPSCSFITCCVKKKGLEVCAECPDFPCTKFKSKIEYEQLKESFSYPSCKRILPNLNYIKEYGIERFIGQQKQRIRILETMLEQFNEGRSKSFFCKMAGSLDLESLNSSLDKAARKIKAEKIKQNDLYNKARIIRATLNEHIP